MLLGDDSALNRKIAERILSLLEERDQFLDLGMNGYLGKPIEWEKLDAPLGTVIH